MVKETSKLIESALGTVSVHRYKEHGRRMGRVENAPLSDANQSDAEKNFISRLRSNVHLVLQTLFELRNNDCVEAKTLHPIVQRSIAVCEELNGFVEDRNKMQENQLGWALDIIREHVKESHAAPPDQLLEDGDDNLVAAKEREVRELIKRNALALIKIVRKLRNKKDTEGYLHRSDSDTRHPCDKLRKLEKWFNDFHPGMAFLECECTSHDYYRDTLWYNYHPYGRWTPVEDSDSMQSFESVWSEDEHGSSGTDSEEGSEEDP
jgi:hypothetical protein